MNDKETFGELVQAVEELSRPWKVAFAVTNFIWAWVFLVHTLV